MDLQGTSTVTEGGRDTHGLRDGGGAAEDDTGCVAQLESVDREPVHDAVRTLMKCTSSLYCGIIYGVLNRFGSNAGTRYKYYAKLCLAIVLIY